MRRSDIMDAENMAPLQRLNRTNSEIRKVNKPLMEKRRRERINQCLDQLKTLLMDVTKKENSFYSKLEKADILELTVKYLKNQKRQTSSASITGDASSSIMAASKYTAGFLQCTNEVDQYLGTVEGMTPELRSTLLGHLTTSLRKSGRFTATATVKPQSTPQPSAVVAVPPAASAVFTVGPGGCPSVSTQLPIQLVPAQLPTGDVVYLLANPQNFTSYVQPHSVTYLDAGGASGRPQSFATGTRYEHCPVSTTTSSAATGNNNYEIISPAASPVKHQLKSEVTFPPTSKNLPGVTLETSEDRSCYQPIRQQTSSVLTTMTSPTPKFPVSESLENEYIQSRLRSIDGVYNIDVETRDVNNNPVGSNGSELVWRPW